MRRLLLALFSLYAIAGFDPPGASAQSLGTMEDMRCILSLMRLSSVTKDENAKRSINSIAFYFMGKINGRDPEADLYKLTKLMRPTLGEKDMSDAVVDCIASFKKRTAEFDRIADALRELGY